MNNTIIPRVFRVGTKHLDNTHLKLLYPFIGRAANPAQLTSVSDEHNISGGHQSSVQNNRNRIQNFTSGVFQARPKYNNSVDITFSVVS